MSRLRRLESRWNLQPPKYLHNKNLQAKSLAYSLERWPAVRVYLSQCSILDLPTLTFQARNWAVVILKLSATRAHVSPATASYHLLQVEGIPVCVGLSGVEIAVLVVAEPLTPTQYESPTQKFWVQLNDTAGYLNIRWHPSLSLCTGDLHSRL